MKILVVDNDPFVLQNLRRHLEKPKWHINTATSYEEASERMEQQKFDVLLCDYKLSSQQESKDGLELARNMRKKNNSMPIIILTGRPVHEISSWEALDAGVDDFITKPYRGPEIVSRIKAVFRRSFPCANNSTNLLQQGDVSIDLDTKKVCLGKRNVHFTKTMYLLLIQFLQRPNKLIPYEELIEYIWGISDHCGSLESHNKLRVHMTHLKKRLGKSRSQRIRTVHGQGFVWSF